MSKGKASNQSLYSTNDLSTQVRKKIRYAQPNTTVMNDHWRKAKEADPTLEYRITFCEWKKTYLKEFYKRKDKRKRNESN
jgi:hypothetical protein